MSNKNDMKSNIMKQENKMMLKKHNFTNAIQQINKFSKMATKDIEITPVQTEGTWFSFNNHNVTGTELNEVTAEIQEYLIELNNLQIKFVREFGKIYEAFNYLDKDYIDAINNNVQSIGVVSNQALTASEQANEAAIQAQKANKNVEAALDTQKKIVDTLCIFKADIDKIKHIWNIDEIWENTEDAREKINKLGDELKKLHGVVDATALQTESNYNRIQDQLKNLSTDISQAFAIGEQANEAAVQAQKANKNVEEDLAKLHEAFDDVVLQIENSQNNIQKQFEDVASKIKQLKNDTEEENAQLTDRITKQEQQISRLNFVSTTALIVGIAGILLFIRGIV